MQLGVRRGQRLLALSDPLRYGQMWSLLDRPSLRFVIDTFKMRRSSPIDLAFEPMLGAAGGCGSEKGSCGTYGTRLGGGPKLAGRQPAADSFVACQEEEVGTRDVMWGWGPKLVYGNGAARA